MYSRACIQCAHGKGIGKKKKTEFLHPKVPQPFHALHGFL